MWTCRWQGPKLLCNMATGGGLTSAQQFQKRPKGTRSLQGSICSGLGGFLFHSWCADLFWLDLPEDQVVAVRGRAAHVVGCFGAPPCNKHQSSGLDTEWKKLLRSRWTLGKGIAIKIGPNLVGWGLNNRPRQWAWPKRKREAEAVTTETPTYASEPKWVSPLRRSTKGSRRP